jgi:hypothetical protein
LGKPAAAAAARSKNEPQRREDAKFFSHSSLRLRAFAVQAFFYPTEIIRAENGEEKLRNFVSPWFRI